MAISVSYLSIVRRVATSVVLLVLSLIAGQVEARAQSSDARLTPDEWQRLVAAHEKVKTNPAVHSLKLQLETVLRRDIRDADNSLGPVLAKIKVGDLEEIKAARDPADKAIDTLSKTTEKLELRDQQQAEAETNRQNVYEAIAKKLDEIKPDHKDAESAVSKLKSDARQCLGSGQIQELFSGIDRHLDFNHEQRVKILKETGYDELKYDFDLIDWKKTRAAAKEFAANNSARENAKPPKEEPRLAPVAPNQATPIPHRASVESLSPPLLGVAVVALFTAIWLLYRRQPPQAEMQTTDDALASNEAWFFADCPRCEWRHANPDGILDSEASLKCASCGGVFEPRWRQEQAS